MSVRDAFEAIERMGQMLVEVHDGIEFDAIAASVGSVTRRDTPLELDRAWAIVNPHLRNAYLRACPQDRG
jgi:hypothetical protein